MNEEEHKITPTPKAERKEPYWAALNEIIDPEVGIGIVDLGLIYTVNVDKHGFAVVQMTLTSPMCPVGPVLVMQVEDKMRLQKEIKEVQIEMVWDPPWNQEMIDEDIRALYM